MKRHFLFMLAVVIGLSLPFAACSNDDARKENKTEQQEALLVLVSPFLPGPEVDYRSRESATEGRLLTAQRQWSLPLGYAASMTRFDGYPEFTSAYAVDYYTITYETLDLDDNLVAASGCVWVPQSSSPLPVLVYCHGTNISTSVMSQHVQVGLFAGKGYFAAGPDYLGYQASVSLGHPYVHAKTLARSSMDLLRAAKKFAEYNGITISNKLFVAGYSEGGMAALATVRLLEDNLIPITAAAVGSGPYDLRGSVDALLKPNTIVNPNNVVFLVTAYNAIYSDLRKPLSYYLKEPYATWLTDDPYPRPDSSAISAQLPKNTDDLLQAAFITSYNDGSEFELEGHLDENATYTFKPKCPLTLYAGDGDTIVPADNTRTAYNYFLTAPAAPNVTQVVLDASYGDHGPLVLPIFSRLLTWFAGF